MLSSDHPAVRSVCKRLLDICVASTLLIVLAPVLLITALLIAMSLGRPILFRQQRPGLLAEPFLMIKFRTMRSGTGADGQPLPDDQRLTRLGKFLRATSIDELPEFWNVLTGRMSLVGPRPLLLEYLPHYSDEQAQRHLVKPGITGWAQVNGRNATAWNDRLGMDIWYVNNWSFWLDIRILVRTLIVTLTRQGISAEGHATMPRFDQHVQNDKTPQVSDSERS